MIIVLLGAPGAGKGTQASAICDHFKFPHVSTGDIFRSHLQNNTALGQEAKPYIDSGKLVPDDLVIRLVSDRISQPDAKNGFLLDGFPRTLTQGEALDEALKNKKLAIDHCVYLNVPDDELITRLAGRRVCEKCGYTCHINANNNQELVNCSKCSGKLYQRSDDSEDTVKNRLKVYHEQTSPLIDWYKNKGLLRPVIGMGSVDEIRLKIAHALGLKAL